MGALPGKAADMADNDLGTLLGGLLGGSKEGSLLGSLLGALGSGGGESLSGLLQQLQEGGLGGKTDSWVGTGPNAELSGPEVAQALPYQALDHVAQKAGVTPEEAADQLARVIPRAVDKLTPGGEVPQGSLEEVIAHHQGG
ncbi:YidB family protein [Streptomyces sp. NPDC020379]|uniref:YidB family protein n=1 Tax=Streptomyces sp. NPDC020379 TaxID=3365071 RepID=UPI0037A458CA